MERWRSKILRKGVWEWEKKEIKGKLEGGLDGKSKKTRNIRRAANS